MSDQEIIGHGNERLEITALEDVPEALPAEEKAVKKLEETPKAPEAEAIGDEKIAILKHDIYRKGGEGDITEAICIELTIKNSTDVVIGSVLFEAVLYDIEGNILDTVEYKTIDLKPGISRNLHINYSGQKSDRVKSYCVRVAKIKLTPEPTATGNDRIAILRHGFSVPQGDEHDWQADGIELAIRNVSEAIITRAILEAVFYDIEGNTLDTVEHTVIYLKPNTSRTIIIPNPPKQRGRIPKSYSIKITKTVTTDVEKLIIRRQEITRTNAGEEEIRGVVKNLSLEKTDAAMVATFYNPKKENIGVKVLILRNIEPEKTKQFHFLFKPQAEDKVRSYSLNIGEIADNIE